MVISDFSSLSVSSSPWKTFNMEETPEEREEEDKSEEEEKNEGEEEGEGRGERN